MWVLRWQKSIQNHRPPSFFLTTPHTLTMAYGAWIHHFSQMVMNLFHQWWEILSESFFKRVIVSDFDHIFSQMSAAKLTGLQEDIVIFSQERLGGIHQLWWPGFQSTEVKLLKQFLLPLLYIQLGHWRALDLIHPLHCISPHRWLWHPCCSTCSHYCGLFP